MDYGLWISLVLAKILRPEKVGFTKKLSQNNYFARL